MTACFVYEINHWRNAAFLGAALRHSLILGRIYYATGNCRNQRLIWHTAAQLHPRSCAAVQKISLCKGGSVAALQPFAVFFQQLFRHIIQLFCFLVVVQKGAGFRFGNSVERKLQQYGG